jgi:glycosyltransferase involved in cell wall biosynthesis
MKFCIIIPVYNHDFAVLSVLENLKKFQLPCILVNDGSSAECRQNLIQYTQQRVDWVMLIDRPKNGGKGIAVLDGFKYAIAKGFTHVIQIDADGQHNTNDILKIIEISRNAPNHLIFGKPVYESCAPLSRRYGRYIANFWVWVNTLSFAIADGMCGFRLYPLHAVQKLLNNDIKLESGMAFDIDIAVRLYWQKFEVINFSTIVTYPLDGISHFKILNDNWQITKTHTKLFFGMLFRIVDLIARHF